MGSAAWLELMGAMGETESGHTLQALEHGGVVRAYGLPTVA